MDKIKNFLVPGKAQDDETLYGAGQPGGTHSKGLSGEGSHLESATANTKSPTGVSDQQASNVGNTPGTALTGQRTSGLGDKSGPVGGLTDQQTPRDASLESGQSATHSGGLSGQGSHLSSANSGPTSGVGDQASGVTNTTTTQPHPDQHHTGQSHLGRDAALGAGGMGLAEHERQRHETEPRPGLASTTSDQYDPFKEGRYDKNLESNQNTGLGSGSSTGPHVSNIANRADPRVDSDNSRSTGQPGLVGTTPGNTGLGNTETAGATTPGQHMPGEWIEDAGTSGPTETGLGGSNTGSGHHLGRDAEAVGTAGIVGEGIHSHQGNERNLNSAPRETGLVQDSHQPGASTGYTGDTQGLNTSSGNHLGRDAAAIGTAGAIGEGIHSHRDAEQSIGSTNPGSTLHTESQGPHTTDTANRLDPSVNTRASGYESAHNHSPTRGGGAEEADKHHLGRDTAIGAGALGLAAHEHKKHQNERESGVGTTSGVSHSTTGPSPTTDLDSTTRGSGAGTTSGLSHSAVGPSGPAPRTAGPHSQDWKNVLDPRVTPKNAVEKEFAQAESQSTSSNPSDHHYGRDAAVGAGTVGAAGLAGNEYEKHQTRSAGTGNTSGISKPSSGTDTIPPSDRSQTGTHTKPTDSSSHHYGRDAALGAGALGAAGLAGSESQKHHTEAGAETGNTSNISKTVSGTSGLSGPAPNTAGPHSKDWMNKLDPRVTSNPTVAQGNPQAEAVLAQSNKPDGSTGGYVGSTHDPKSTTSDQSGHHYGRDAAVVGGVGTAAYAAGKHHDKSAMNDSPQVGQARDPYQEISTTAQPSTIGRKADPTTDSTHSKDHHYGRDVAVAGGVGGAAYEADKHHNREKDLAKAEHDAKKDHKHDLKEAEKQRKHEEKKERKESKGGLFSFLHRDKSKKYTAEEEAEFDRQEREHGASQSHTGRDAALGGAALGAGAYEAEKHHQADTNKSLPTAPGNHGIGTGAGTQNALSGNTSGTTQDSHLGGTSTGHHTERDAAIGAGAVGAAGLGAHEHSQHSGPTPLDSKPPGKDIGDHLHGVERNRGVEGASGFPGTAGFGDGSTGHHGSLSEATTDREGRPVGSGMTGDEQTGRQFPLAAAGTTQHGHQKHDSGYQTGNTGDKLSTGETTSGLTGSEHHSSHHTGRDAAALGGAGLVGEHEYRKHHDATSSHHQSGLTGAQGKTEYQGGRDATGAAGLGATGQQDYRQPDTSTGLTGSNNQSDLADSHSSGLIGGKAADHSGRNKLHKDPPASHPASQAYAGSGNEGGAHVPSSGVERDHILEQGKERLGEDTGVANAHDTNPSTNY